MDTLESAEGSPVAELTDASLLLHESAGLQIWRASPSAVPTPMSSPAAASPSGPHQPNCCRSYGEQQRTSFSAAVREAGLSRIYAGHHARLGQTCGIARAVTCALRAPQRPSTWLSGGSDARRRRRVDGRENVDRFDRAELAALLEASLGSSPADDLVERIYRRSEGNAFFAEELLSALRERDGNAHLPPRLENVLLSRVQILPEDAQATLRIVAAASGPVEHELLAAVSDLPAPDLLAALRVAVAHQVLVPDPASETNAFRHALTQEALYGDLLPGERAQLHAAFARVLSERSDLAGPSHGATSARLAYHWVRAHNPAQALPAAMEAGLQSQAAYGSPTRCVISRPFSSCGIRLPIPSSSWRHQGRPRWTLI
jgi:hypothetical protein